MTKALHLLTNYKPSRPTTQRSSNNVSFAQKGKKGNNNSKNNGEKDDSWHKDTICHHCKKKGHIKPNCPDLDKNFNNNGEEESQSADESEEEHRKPPAKKSAVRTVWFASWFNVNTKCTLSKSNVTSKAGTEKYTTINL